MEIIKKAKDYAIKCHNMTAHKYDGKPYETHLQLVFDVAKRFIYLIPIEHRDNVLAACWTHDVIEDCRQTYSDVEDATNTEIAELSYALTNEKGKTRQEKANDKYYTGIKKTPFATFIKLCDRIANYEYSKQQGGVKIKMYDKEMNNFIDKLYDAKYNDMFSYLKK